MQAKGKFFRRLGIISLIMLLIASGLLLYLARSSAHAIVYPDQTPVRQTPADVGVDAWAPVSFTTSDGVTIEGWFIYPQAREGVVLVMVHGNGANRAQMLPQAALVQEAGYGALLIDLRHHGASERAATTLGHNEMRDVQAAVEFLQRQEEVNVTEIGALGFSLGAGAVIRAAARTPAISLVVAEAGYTSVEDNVADGVRLLTGLPAFPFAPLLIWFGERETGVDLSEVRPVDDVARIAPRPLLLIHGSDDPLLPLSQSERLLAAAGEPKQLAIIPGAGHGDYLAAAPDLFAETLLSFLAAHWHVTTPDG